MSATICFGDRLLSLAGFEFLTRSCGSTARIRVRREELVRPPERIKPSGGNLLG